MVEPEVGDVVFVRAGGGGEMDNPYKNPQGNAGTNNRLNPHVTTGQAQARIQGGEFL